MPVQPASSLPPNEITMAPTEGPVSAWAPNAFASALTLPTSEGPINPALLAAQQAAQTPAWNPIGVGARIANLGVPQSAVAQALMELGLTG